MSGDEMCSFFRNRLNDMLMGQLYSGTEVVESPGDPLQAMISAMESMPKPKLNLRCGTIEYIATESVPIVDEGGTQIVFALKNGGGINGSYSYFVVHTDSEALFRATAYGAGLRTVKIEPHEQGEEHEE